MIRDIEREKYRRDNQRSPKLVGFRGIRGSSFALRRAGTITREHAENARGGGEGGGYHFSYISFPAGRNALLYSSGAREERKQRVK